MTEACYFLRNLYRLAAIISLILVKSIIFNAANSHLLMAASTPPRILPNNVGYVDLIFDSSGRCLIGRLNGSGPIPQVGTHHPCVSRMHAVIRRSGKDRFTIQDLGSRHGTWLWDRLWHRLNPSAEYALAVDQAVALGKVSGPESLNRNLALILAVVRAPAGGWRVSTDVMD